jgi:hypothetical protein
MTREERDLAVAYLSNGVKEADEILSGIIARDASGKTFEEVRVGLISMDIRGKLLCNIYNGECQQSTSRFIDFAIDPPANAGAIVAKAMDKSS